MIKYAIKINEEAVNDYKESFSYYSNISTQLAHKFENEVEYLIDKIETEPLHFQLKYRIFRVAFTKTFPFGIHFFIENNIIFIQRILHNKRFYK